MSLEDLDLDFQSAESDYESDKNLSDDEKDDDDDPHYLDLVYLYCNLMCFQQIYYNNAIMDNECMENEDGMGFDFAGYESAFLQYGMNGVLEGNYSSSPSSGVWNEDDSAPSCVQDFAQLYEEVSSTSSSSLSENSDVVDGQMTEHRND